MSNGALVVFAKAPRPGEVKTRMSPPLEPEVAAALYACLLDDCLEQSARLAEQFGLEPVLAVHPAPACAQLARCAPLPFRVIPQRGADLGARMATAALELAAGGIARVVLRGSDSPVLDAGIVGAALAALSDHALSICPDLDGGYNLVALSNAAVAHAAKIFDHPMSHASVLEATKENAENLGLRVACLEPSFDLDTASDLTHLARARREGRALSCPRTLAFLDESGLWPSAHD